MPCAHARHFAFRQCRLIERGQRHHFARRVLGDAIWGDRHCRLALRRVCRSGLACRRWRVEPAALRSQGKHTPFGGHELPVRVRATLVAGQVAYEASRTAA